MFKTNQYFDGKVVSIGFQGEQLPSTVGVMAPGEYEFGTSQREYVTVISGELVVKLPGAADWQRFGPGATFIVEANQRFDLRVAVDTAYLCKYE